MQSQSQITPPHVPATTPAEVESNFSKLSGTERDWRVGEPTSPEKYRERLINRFWSKVDTSPGQGPKGECWEWQASITTGRGGGYGQMGVKLSALGLSAPGADHRPLRAHVIAYCFVYGHDDVSPLGFETHVCHECNNKKCVREEHLFSGTPLENMRHAQATGLVPKVDHELRARLKREEQERRNVDACMAREFIDRHLHLVSSPRAKTILQMRYGYTHNTCQTLEEVGTHFGITRERVRQVQQVAEERIRMYTIEKNIPLPSNNNPNSLDRIRDTLLEMKVGDSFVMNREQKQNVRVSTVAKMLGFLVTTRKISDTEMRVWLVTKTRVTDDQAA